MLEGLSGNGIARKDLWTCCSRRVPDRLRRQNPKAYTPQMLAIGLHHNRTRNDSEVYRNIELHKEKCLNKIRDTYGDERVQKLEEIIERDEEFMRDSYSQSSIWYSNKDIVEMILRDSVFILLFFIQTESTLNFSKKEDILFILPRSLEEHVLTIIEDLVLLENQLPFALLEELFETFFSNINTTEETLHDLVLRKFAMEGQIKEGVRFLHFTDILWRVRVSALPLTTAQISIARSKPPRIRKIMHNVEKLYSAGVDFVPLDAPCFGPLVIIFEKGILTLPCFKVNENTERYFGNQMALEQCLYPETTYICDYVSFLNFLINTSQDVDVLATKGIVMNWLVDHGSVAQMLKNVCLGHGVGTHSHYYDDVIERLNKYYENPFNRSVGALKRVYFKDIWTGTATVAASILLILTLIQTVASIVK